MTRRGRRRRDRGASVGLRLEHRQGDITDLDKLDDFDYSPADAHDDAAGTTALSERTRPVGTLGPAGSPEVPAVVVRLVDQHDHPVGGAHAYRRGDLDDWVLPSATHTLRLRAQRTHELTYRRRPTRRTFLDTTDSRPTRAYLARTRRRPKRWEFTAPNDLEPDAVLLCLWLVHLLDVHALLGRAWEPPGPAWTPVVDEFPTWVGPGGFGDSRPATTSPGSVGGGASTGGN